LRWYLTCSIASGRRRVDMQTTQTAQAMQAQASNEPLVQFKDIRKAFGGVHAVDGVNLNLYPGEVVAVLGHNGAGKSTLMKMLAGAFPIDSGEIHVMGKR
jgi:D-xylose transport system ATP-binding protein